MRRNRILVLGRHDIDKVALVNKIISESKQQVQSSTKESTALIPWTIETKYYTANVAFWIDDTIANKDREAIATYMNEENGVGNAIDAILFVFDKDRKETFKDLEHFLPFVAKYEPAITLAIGQGCTDNKSDVESFDDWCIKNYFEFVDLEAKAEENKGDEFIEQVGIGRVLEALQSHMWDGLKSREKQQAKDEDSLDPVLQAEESKDLKLEQALVSLQVSDHDESDEDDLFSLLVDGSSVNDADTIPSRGDVDDLRRQLFGDWDNDEERSFGHDNIEKAFQMIKSMKENSKDMPIEQRKKMAALVALSFGMQM